MHFHVIGPSWPFRGGIAHYTTLLVRELRRTHQVALTSFDWLYPAAFYPGSTARDPSSENSALRERVDRRISPLNPLTWLALIATLRHSPPDALIMNWWSAYWSPLMYAVLKATHARTHRLIICHNTAPPGSGGAHLAAAKHVLKQSDSILAVTELDRALLQSWYPGRRVCYARLPPTALSGRPAPTQAEARRQLALDEQACIVLFFGFVRDYKGLPVLLKALQQARPARCLRLIIAGEFWEPAERYRQLIAQLKLEHVVRMDAEYVPNERVPLYFAACDAVAAPYLRHTASGVVQLALAQRKWVIGSAVAGIAESIEHGHNGWLSPPGDVAALARNLERLTRVERKPDATAGRSANREHEWSHTIGQIESMVASL